MRIRSPEPEKPPGTAISPTSFSFARMTPLRGARSVVYSSATRACCELGLRRAHARRGGVGLGAADVELLLRHDPLPQQRFARARASPSPARPRPARRRRFASRAIDGRAVVARVELDQRIAGRARAIAFLDQVAVDAARHA